jgi:hypothetical protein
VKLHLPSKWEALPSVLKKRKKRKEIHQKLNKTGGVRLDISISPKM